MASFNNCSFSGYVGRDPELRYFESGKTVANFSIAVDNRQGETLWIAVKVWGKGAEVIGNYVKKGSQIIVNGELQQESWEKDGEKKTKIALNCTEFKLIGSKKDSDGARVDKEDASVAKQPIAAPAQAGFDDDIPF
jgi:single-strand DNA-binding protein